MAITLGFIVETEPFAESGRVDHPSGFPFDDFVPLEQLGQHGSFKFVLALAQLFQQQEGFSVDSARQSPGPLMDMANLVSREWILQNQPRRPETVFQIIGRLFFIQWCHIDFVDHRFGGQPAGDIGEAFPYAGFGKQDQALKFPLFRIRKSGAQQFFQLRWSELMGVVDDERGRGFTNGTIGVAVVQILPESLGVVFA